MTLIVISDFHLKLIIEGKLSTMEFENNRVIFHLFIYTKHFF